MPKDNYSNLAYGFAEEIAAGTIAFGEIHSGVSMFEKVAWLVSRIEYNFVNTFMNLMIANTDVFHAGLTATSAMTALGMSDSSVIDRISIQRTDFGTPGSAQLTHMPIIKDFSTMPGGGLLIPPNPLYAAVQGISMAAVVKVSLRIYFTYVSLKPEEYWELVESRRIIS